MDKKDKKFQSVDAYIKSQDKEAKEKLKILREIIKKNAPDAVETISYNMPAYKFSRVLAYFAAFKNHYSIFPGPKAILAFKDELKGYITSKGTIQFLYNKPIPKCLISNIVKYRVKEILEKKKAKKG
jgi:uncharacterized protein YdhG (YjbR/CyaY superfamily)